MLEPCIELTGGSLCEGDGAYLAYIYPSFDHRNHAVNEHGCFSGARAGLDEEIGMDSTDSFKHRPAGTASKTGGSHGGF